VSTSVPERPYRVMAVDDNEIHCYSLRKLLSTAGFEVSHAHSGREALKMVGVFRPDAVLLDVGMNDMDGYEVCSAIRADTQNNAVAIIFHSASGHANHSPDSNENGDAFLTYPVDSEHLISVIRGCIQRRRDTHGRKSNSATEQMQ
jgi:DNA-binding response OmpR family regulator